MSCNINVPVANGVYPCAYGKSVAWAEKKIQKTFNITGGSILCDGVGADDSDLIEAGHDYIFFRGSIASKFHPAIHIPPYFPRE